MICFYYIFMAFGDDEKENDDEKVI